MIKTLLRTSTKHGKMRVYDAWVDDNNNGYASSTCTTS